MTKRADAAALSLVDLVKALASQAILLHHFALYGPMSDVINPLLGALTNWLVADARLAVQCFLVVAGFLAAQSLLANPQALTLSEWVQRSLARFRRLALPLVPALLLALLAAELAVGLSAHRDNPVDPLLLQALANLFMVQDIVGQEALSAGVWYVAIDLQLYLLFALLLIAPRRVALGLVAALTIASLLWFNRHAGLDMWAIYFFGAYGLGIAAWFGAQQPPAMRIYWFAGLCLLLLVVLLIDWRSRILLAGLTALLLLQSGGNAPLGEMRRPVAWLARISYLVFLFHYPILLAVGAVVHHLWPGNPVAAACGLLLAWGSTLALAHVLEYRLTLKMPAAMACAVSLLVLAEAA